MNAHMRTFACTSNLCTYRRIVVPTLNHHRFHQRWAVLGNSRSPPRHLLYLQCRFASGILLYTSQ